jgi:hypothetical protein
MSGGHCEMRNLLVAACGASARQHLSLATERREPRMQANMEQHLMLDHRMPGTDETVIGVG